ncbi:MAG TPA: hypothetical protein VFO60_10865 [Candidatus Dormibacteraeota bacterium]|nr:hypothetical protein [Candidatus Dormibacteraeota bacterium]
MESVHRTLGLALVAVAAVGTVWAFVSGLLGRTSRALRAFVRLCALAVVAQVVVGLLLLATGHRPADALHLVYGGVVLLCIPSGIAYATGGDARREAWALSAGLLAAVLVAARAIATGG